MNRFLGYGSLIQVNSQPRAFGNHWEAVDSTIPKLGFLISRHSPTELDELLNTFYGSWFLSSVL
jgi:hypothetical protein